jgi:hypothetical protein
MVLRRIRGEALSWLGNSMRVRAISFDLEQPIFLGSNDAHARFC